MQRCAASPLFARSRRSFFVFSRRAKSAANGPITALRRPSALLDPRLSLPTLFGAGAQWRRCLRPRQQKKAPVAAGRHAEPRRATTVPQRGEKRGVHALWCGNGYAARERIHLLLLFFLFSQPRSRESFVPYFHGPYFLTLLCLNQVEFHRLAATCFARCSFGSLNYARWPRSRFHCKTRYVVAHRLTAPWHPLGSTKNPPCGHPPPPL